MQENKSENLDLIWGAKEIAAALRCNERKAWYLLAKGKLPAKKVGKTWVVSREQLRQFFTASSAA